MKKISLWNALVVLFLTIAALPSNAQSVNLEWVKNCNMPSNYQNTVATAVDKQGNIFYSGFFQKPLTMGTDTILRAIGGTDGFVIKMAPSGKVEWAKQIGITKGNCQVFDVKTDQSGNVYVSGMFTATMDFNPGGGGTDILTANSGWDGFVCKYDATGKYLWARNIGSSGYDVADYLAIDAFNNVYISGFFQGLIDLDPSAGVDTFRIMGGTSYDRYVCKLDSTGKYIWGMHYQRGSSIGNIEGLALDPSGNAYITGSFFQSMGFPAKHGIPSLVAVQPYDMYLVKISPTGNIVWAKSFGGNGDGDFGYDIVADNNYNVYIVGNFNRTADLDPGIGIQSFSSTTNSYYDMFVLKVDSAGDYVWAKTFGGRKHDNGLAIAVDQSGNVYATGSFQDTMSFVPGSTKPEDGLIGVLGYNIFVVKFDASGGYVWSKSFGTPGTAPAGGTGPNRGDDITVDHSGNVYVAGVFKDIVDFDPGAGKVELNAATGALFLMKLSCNDTTNATIAASSCSDYTYNGQVYDATGIYTQKYRNASGCDSTVYLNLSINPIGKPDITINGFTLGTVDTYATYQWMLAEKIIQGATQRELTVTANGIYRVVVTNEKGCSDTSDMYKVTNYKEVSVDDIDHIAQQVHIYPNPTTDVLFVNAPVSVNLMVNSIEGRQLRTAKNSKQISLQELAPGLYILNITDLKGHLLKVEKLIKQ